jgi:hypothetical protein
MHYVMYIAVLYSSVMESARKKKSIRLSTVGSGKGGGPQRWISDWRERGGGDGGVSKGG